MQELKTKKKFRKRKIHKTIVDCLFYPINPIIQLTSMVNSLCKNKFEISVVSVIVKNRFQLCFCASTIFNASKYGSRCEETRERKMVILLF